MMSVVGKLNTLIKESYHDVENPDQLRVIAFSTLKASANKIKTLVSLI